jgi:hypothetical protein
MNPVSMPVVGATTPTYLSDPQVQYIGTVLDEIKRGNLLIPRFQRRFVWKLDQQLELLRSVRDGIPIGSFLVWRTSQVRLKTFRQLGGHPVPGPPEPTPGALRSYLLDGHQRLSTLFAALSQPSVSPTDNGAADEEDPQEVIQYVYDLDGDDFRPAPVEAQPTLLPTNILLDSIALLKFQRDKLVRLDRGEDYIGRSERLANAFRNYKVPMVPLVTDNLEDATRAFQRINSSGTPMSDYHMVAALTFTDRFDLSEEMERARADLADVGWDWEDLDEKYILATVRAHAKLRIVSPDADATSKAIAKKPALIEEAVNNLRLAAAFLRQACGVPSPHLLPYSYQGVVMAEAFRQNPNPDTSVREALKTWFWRTSYLAYFLGARDNDVNDALREIRELVTTGRTAPVGPGFGNVEALPKRHDFRNARSKVFLLRLASLMPQDHDGHSFDAVRCLAAYEARAAMQLLVPGDPASVNASGPENRFIIEPEKISGFRALLHDPSANLSDAFLRSHVIDREFLAAVHFGHYAEALRRRRIGLLSIEEEFVKALGLTYLPDIAA